MKPGVETNKRKLKQMYLVLEVKTERVGAWLV